MREGRSSTGVREGAVVAYTTDDDGHPAVGLYAADAASVWSEPMPNRWASEGEDKRFGDRLSPEDLDFLGRAPMATQVREARAGGVPAYGWLPKDHGPRIESSFRKSSRRWTSSALPSPERPGRPTSCRSRASRSIASLRTGFVAEASFT